ncbi:hypothetical protein Acsp06_59840 [Actinomycetospora sp. NBRC 106375]|uniref:RNA polymerase sigma factor n=1 Tax=Actinomycetospora sp. NBRC 106375 TaxID=3032207 RepID=UPI0024A28195|nr:RNA polymerase sigma factor [Actinomycetospora sp. NBRC 106375]GLZ49799.1 hypothetical protein Acsp06_59840 [Actinomycetospora sp. NBRC 106375]
MSVDTSVASRSPSSGDGPGAVDGLIEVFATERTRMLRYARHLLGHRGEDAEDVVQEIMRKAYRRPPALRDPRALRAYVYAAVHHESTTWGVRSAAEGRRRGSDESPLALLPEPGPGIDDRIVHHLVVARALARLSPRERQIVELVDLRRYTEKEAARALGLAIGSVKSYHHAARRRLRDDPDLAELVR